MCYYNFSGYNFQFSSYLEQENVSYLEKTLFRPHLFQGKKKIRKEDVLTNH